MKHLWKKLKKTVPWILAAIVVITLFFSVVVDMFGLVPGQGKEVLVAVQHGDTVSEIAKTLKEDGVIHHPLLFRLYVRITGGDYLFQRGGHKVGKSISYGKIARQLTEAPDVRYDETVKVLIPEGYEARQIAEALEEKGLADKESFLKELEEGDFDFPFLDNIERKENRLEGYLFPATYEFSIYESERDIITKMLDAFEVYILPLYNQAQTELSLDEVVTFASVVEREAANDSERPIVASVFYNRMNADMTLSSCATVQYIIKERKPVLSNSDIKIKSPYNTYINKGLPVGPVASPGVNSVKAVLSPANTDYLYFAARADGSENVFARTGEEHLRNVNILQGK
ncbi:MAG: endolytic transglycosylase MltG [Ruminococcaceae bacterium]|nr:endolytic transglycosylase MltG [Oscillospiraceae bacterium]